MAHHDHHADDGEVHAHISTVPFYGFILGILFLMTGLTFALSFLHLGSLNLAVAVVIATIKASLVVLFFMHLKYDSKFNAMLLVGALLFAGVFLAYTINDTNYRGLVDPQNGVHVDPATGLRAAGGPPGYEPMIRASGAHHGEGGEGEPHEEGEHH